MRPGRSGGLAFLVIALYGIALWWLQVLPNPGNLKIGLTNLDQHIEHLPMARYGFAALRAGELPLWNPYQLAGMPFFAVPHTGLLYPGHLIYWLIDVPRAIELTAVLHLVFGGVCCYALGRQLGMRATGATVAACVLIGSGVWMALAQQLTLQRALPWLPATALAIERTLTGSRWGPLGVAACMASQALLGATELIVYNSYAAMLFGAVRACALASRAGLGATAARVAVAVLAAAVGVGLAAVQLVPSFELAELSARRAGALSLQGALFVPLALSTLLGELVAVENRPALGLLAVVGLLLGPGARGTRSGWFYAVAVTALGIHMAIGGLLYELHFQTPIGALFRYTHKWLLLYAFGGALLAGFAVTRLEAWSGDSRLLGLAATALAAAAAALGLSGHTVVPLAVSTAALAAFAFIRLPGLRSTLVVGLVLFDLGLLLANPSTPHVRPSHRPALSDAKAAVWRAIGEHVGNQRVFISPELMMRPDLTFKQGMLRRVRVSEDYEPLALARYARYFRAATGHRTRHPYSGFHRLTPTTRLDWLDWTATRLYVASTRRNSGGVLRRAVARGDATVWRLARGFAIYERPSAMPRAWIVPAAHPVADESAALSALASPTFDPRVQVLLEGLDADATLDPADASPLVASVEFARDDPEHVELRVASDRSSWLVLADAWYPGWEARIDGVAVPVLRANSLFRAVRIEAGSSLVSFDFRPRSVRIGAAVSAASALALLVLVALWQRSRGLRPAAGNASAE